MTKIRVATLLRQTLIPTARLNSNTSIAWKLSNVTRPCTTSALTVTPIPIMSAAIALAGYGACTSPADTRPHDTTLPSAGPTETFSAFKLFKTRNPTLTRRSNPTANRKYLLRLTQSLAVTKFLRGFAKKLRLTRPTRTALRHSREQADAPSCQPAGIHEPVRTPAFVAPSTAPDVGRWAPYLVEGLGERPCAAPTARRLPSWRGAGERP